MNINYDDLHLTSVLSHSLGCGSSVISLLCISATWLSGGMDAVTFVTSTRYTLLVCSLICSIGILTSFLALSEPNGGDVNAHIGLIFFSTISITYFVAMSYFCDQAALGNISMQDYAIAMLSFALTPYIFGIGLNFKLICM